MKKRVPVVIQMQWGENAAATLAMMLGYYKKYIPLSRVREVCRSSRSGTTPEQLVSAAHAFGLNAEKISISGDALFGAVQKGEISLPVVAGWRKKYYVVIRKIKNEKVFLTDAFRGEHTITLEKFQELYRGFLISMQPGEEFVPEGKPVSLFALIRSRVRGYEKPMVKATVLNAFAIAADLVLLSLNMRMLDQVVSGKQPQWFLPLVIGMFLCVLLNLGFSAVRALWVYQTGRRMASASGAGIFKKLIRLPLRFFEERSAGELLERMEKNSSLDYSLLQGLLPRIVNIVQTALYIGILFYYNASLALACLGLEALHILITAAMQQRLSIISRSIITNSGNLNASILNGLNMVETIKAAGSENQFFNMWRRSQENYHESQRAAAGINALISIENGIHTAVSGAVLLFAGVYFIIQGRFTIGMLSAFQAAWNVVRTEILNCMNTFSSFQTMRTNIERVEDIMEREEIKPILISEGDEVNKLRGGVSIRNLCFRYNSGDGLTLENISLDVKPGQMVALVGPTGCGKSTLVKIIADLYRQESGEILYDGKSRSDIPDAVFHASVTSVDQEITVFRDSVKNNITMWDEGIEDYEMLLSMRDAHIYKRIIRDPDGYNALIEENGRNFSGGELQRIELARALCQDPTLLLLDEFTSALDAATEESIFNSIRDRGVTCIIVAHRLSTVSNCDQVIVLDRGRIVEQGSPQELYDARGLYYELVHMQ